MEYLEGLMLEILSRNVCFSDYKFSSLQQQVVKTNFFLLNVSHCFIETKIPQHIHVAANSDRI